MEVAALVMTAACAVSEKAAAANAAANVVNFTFEILFFMFLRGCCLRAFLIADLSVEASD